jgi:acyl carrier protein
MPMTSTMNEKIFAVLAEHGRLPVSPESLGETDDLYAAGMTSHASISVMLGLEDAFDVEFPDRMLTREVFSSIGSIRAALDELAQAA